LVFKHRPADPLIINQDSSQSLTKAVELGIEDDEIKFPGKLPANKYTLEALPENKTLLF